MPSTQTTSERKSLPLIAQGFSASFRAWFTTTAFSTASCWTAIYSASNVTTAHAGYYHARVRAGRVFFVSNDKVRVDIVIEEGEKMLVARVDLHGLEGLPTPVIADVSQQVKRKLKIDKPFQEEKFDEATKILKTTLEDNGHAFAKVQRTAGRRFTPRKRPPVGFYVTLGPLTHFGQVSIVGTREHSGGPSAASAEPHAG